MRLLRIRLSRIRSLTVWAYMTKCFYVSKLFIYQHVFTIFIQVAYSMPVQRFKVTGRKTIAASLHFVFYIRNIIFVFSIYFMQNRLPLEISSVCIKMALLFLWKCLYQFLLHVTFFYNSYGSLNPFLSLEHILLL